jgi:hypothetical protein
LHGKTPAPHPEAVDHHGYVRAFVFGLGVPALNLLQLIRLGADADPNTVLPSTPKSYISYIGFYYMAFTEHYGSTRNNLIVHHHFPHENLQFMGPFPASKKSR